MNRNAASSVGLSKGPTKVGGATFLRVSCRQIDAMSALSHVYPDRACGSGLRHRWLSAYRQTFAALAVSAAAGLVIFATAAGSLMQGAVAAPPAVKSPPLGWIDIAFADVDAASTGAAVHPQQARVTPSQNTQQAAQDTRKQHPCADFVYYFLNTNCSVKRIGSARRGGFVHRAVAARTLPALNNPNTARSPDRVTVAATMTTVTD